MIAPHDKSPDIWLLACLIGDANASNSDCRFPADNKYAKCTSAAPSTFRGAEGSWMQSILLAKSKAPYPPISRLGVRGNR
ncbi:hypothetical protein CFIMG_008538RA00001 [Ceratocystis fimbriata CBS 114723]|uniref:Uncharacterized protein n=1 Tax=Ceratocystis fimbriata CBS 114723 TaxID=1035309 RepID=A0A2C5X1V4_9PEZI|nr:hypothetical protein CFIMG_008538RA00001 [Ceratocystis fimbriata CBS 114723]